MCVSRGGGCLSFACVLESVYICMRFFCPKVQQVQSGEWFLSRENFMGICLRLVNLRVKMKLVHFLCLLGVNYHKLIYCFDLLSSFCKVVTISYTLLSISIIVFRFYLCLACFLHLKHLFWKRTKIWYSFTFDSLLSGCYCMVYMLLEA